MKQIYTLALTAAFALSASAAGPSALKSAMNGAKQTTRTTVTDGLKSLRKAADRQNAPSRKPAKTAADLGVIENPEGESKDYLLGGVGLAFDMFYGPYVTDLSGLAHIVWGEGNDVYLNNTVMGHTGYVKGTLSDDGTKITVQLPQVIGYDDYSEYGEPGMIYYVSLGDKYDLDENYYQYAMIEGEENVVTYTVNEDGTVVGDFDYSFVEVPGEVDDNGNPLYDWPERLFGLFACYEDAPEEIYFYEEATWTQNYTPFDLVANTVPDGVEMNPDWTVKDAEGRVEFVSVGMDDENVYFGGLLSQALPEAVVIGKIQGDKVVVDAGQYLGYSELYGQFVYLLLGKGEQYYDEEFDETFWDVNWENEDGEFYPSMELSFDRENKVLTSLNDMSFLMNIYADKVDYSILDYYIAPEFTYINPELTNAKPMNPTYLGYDDFSDLDGSYALRWDAPAKTVDGTPLRTENLSYSLYINGELYVFDNDIYYLYDYGIEEPTFTVVPFDINTTDIWYAQSELTVSIWEEEIQTAGMQVFNQGTDQVYESDLVTFEVGISGIADSLAEGKVISKVVYYDLAGRQVNRPSKGIYVTRVTYTDGTHTNAKVMIR